MIVARFITEKYYYSSTHDQLARIHVLDHTPDRNSHQTLDLEAEDEHIPAPHVDHLRIQAADTLHSHNQVVGRIGVDLDLDLDRGFAAEVGPSGGVGWDYCRLVY